MAVYFLQAKLTNHIKIGYANRPEKRIIVIGNGIAGGAQWLGYLPGGRDLEKHLHNKFRDHRVSGEWFEPTPELLHLISTMALPGLPPDEQPDAQERLRFQEEICVAEAQELIEGILGRMCSDIPAVGVDKRAFAGIARITGLEPSLLAAIRDNAVETISAGTLRTLRTAHDVVQQEILGPRSVDRTRAGSDDD